MGRPYKFIGKEIRVSNDYALFRGCFSWNLRNEGDVSVTVNGSPLKPFPPGHPELSGESTGVDGNEGDRADDVLTITFDTAGGGVSPFVVLEQAIYLDCL